MERSRAPAPRAILFAPEDRFHAGNSFLTCWIVPTPGFQTGTESWIPVMCSGRGPTKQGFDHGDLERDLAVILHGNMASSDAIWHAAAEEWTASCPSPVMVASTPLLLCRAATDRGPGRCAAHGVMCVQVSVETGQQSGRPERAATTRRARDECPSKPTGMSEEVR